MKKVDHLLIEAKKIAGYTGPQLTLALIGQDGNCWTATAYLWDLVQGHPSTVETTTHATEDAAMEYIRTLAEHCPNSRDVTVIVDDMG